MTNDVTTRSTGGGLVQLDPAMLEKNLAQFAEDTQARSWVGELLKFVRGKYKAGKDGKIVPIGTQLVVALDTLERGWQRWDNGEITDSRAGLVWQGYQSPTRAELGDTDKSLWPIDPTSGHKRDPWQKSARVVMYGKKGDTSSLYTFISSSYGGIGALGKFAENAGKQIRMHPNCYPVATLKADSYYHSKLKADVDIPIFELVAWDRDPWIGAAIREEVS
jgi:hypothetical protein